jgi:hypothetical protein
VLFSKQVAASAVNLHAKVTAPLVSLAANAAAPILRLDSRIAAPLILAGGPLVQPLIIGGVQVLFIGITAWQQDQSLGSGRNLCMGPYCFKSYYCRFPFRPPVLC